MAVSWEGSVFHALEVLQELLHPGCLWVCTKLLLLGDHAAGTKPALSCWPECHQQHPECPLSVPSSPLGTALSSGSAGYSHHARFGAGAAGDIGGVDEAPRDGQSLVGEAAGGGDTICEGKGHRHGPGETPAAAQPLPPPGICHLVSHPPAGPAPGEPKPQTCAPHCDRPSPRPPASPWQGWGSPAAPKEDSAMLDSPR